MLPDEWIRYTVELARELGESGAEVKRLQDALFESIRQGQQQEATDLEKQLVAARARWDCAIAAWKNRITEPGPNV